MASRGRWHGKVRALAALFAVAAIGVAAPADATSMLWVGGTSGSLGRLVPAGTFGTFDDLLGGAYQDAQTTTIDYPGSLWPITGLLDPTLGSSVHTGTTRLDKAAGNTQGPLVVIGTSQGAMVVQQAEADLNNDPRVSSDTTFILIANPNLGVGRHLYGLHIPGLDYTPAPLPETRFNTIVVINQYDGFADPIARPWNLLTDLNALMGIVYVHPYAQNSDLSSVPAEDITVTTNSQHGTTTVYHVPTEHLPLTMPLRQLGVSSEIVDDIDSALRPVIDRGYQDVGAQPLSAKRSGVRPSSSLRPSAAAARQPKVADRSDRGSHHQRAARPSVQTRTRTAPRVKVPGAAAR